MRTSPMNSKTRFSYKNILVRDYKVPRNSLVLPKVRSYGFMVKLGVVKYE